MHFAESHLGGVTITYLGGTWGPQHRHMPCKFSKVKDLGWTRWHL